MMEEEFISKEELQDLLEVILTEERSYILQDEKLLKKLNSDEVVAMYISNLAAWFIYLGFYILMEEYEICADIKKAITMERETFKSFLREHREDLEEEIAEIIEYIHHMEETLYKTISNVDFDGERNDC
jgi:predicted GIY-YIG superfamily endonuclease